MRDLYADIIADKGERAAKANYEKGASVTEVIVDE